MQFSWAKWRVPWNGRRPLGSVFCNDLAIDLGTANTRIYVPHRGIVLNESSTVAIDCKTRGLEAAGHSARAMVGRNPQNLAVIQPLRDGVIADFSAAEAMLTYFMHQARQHSSTALRPRVVIGVPSEITQVEMRAVTDAVYRAKARQVYVVEQALAAAIGTGLPINEPGGNMIVAIGGGTTEVAVISLSGIVYARSLRRAGNQMDEAVMSYLKRKYNLLIGERTAEQVKIDIGSAFPLDKPLTLEVKGRDLIEGVPKSITVDDTEIREALSECLEAITGAIRVALERTPPELSADICDRGIILTGGGALLRNLDRRVHQETGLPVMTVDDPLYSVVLGAGELLSDTRLLQKVAAA